MFQRTLEALALASLLTLAACSDPCRALADKICSCRPSTAEQNACLEQVKATTAHEPSDSENQRCAELIDGCTCEALEQNELAACGLAK